MAAVEQEGQVKAVREETHAEDDVQQPRQWSLPAHDRATHQHHCQAAEHEQQDVGRKARAVREVDVHARTIGPDTSKVKKAPSTAAPPPTGKVFCAQIGPSTGAPILVRMFVRAQRPDDWPIVRRILTEAFEDNGRVAALAEALQGRADRRPDSALVAESSGEVVGHVQVSRAWIDAESALVDALVLSPLGVIPAQQRHGIGRALCDAAVTHARELGVAAVFLEGDPGYYGRLG